MTLKEQIENIAGTTVTSGSSENADYNNRINSFLKQSARAVLDVLPDKVLIRDSIKTDISNANGITVTDKKIVKVTRAGYGCVEMPLEEKAHLQAGSGSIKEPTKRSPVYYIEGQVTTGGFLFIKPDPTGSEKGQIDFNSYPAPLHSDESITNFPDIAEYAVVIGSALRLLQFKINELIHEDEDPEIAQVAQQEYLNVLGMYKDEIARLNGQLGMGGPSGNE
jgi:hypothetical protein